MILGEAFGILVGGWWKRRWRVGIGNWDILSAITAAWAYSGVSTVTLFPYKMFLFQKTELFPNLNPGGCCTLSLIWKSWHLNIFGRDCKGETVEFVTFLSSLHASKCFFPCVCVWLSAVSWTCVTNCISNFWRLYGEQDISYPNSHDDQEKGLQKWEESPIECKLRRATELGRIFTASSAALTSWAGCWDRDYLKTSAKLQDLSICTGCTILRCSTVQAGLNPMI